MELRGTNAILTGASRGLGVSIAHALAREGARLALASRSAAELEAVATDVGAAGVEVVAIPTDVSDADQCAALVEAAEAALGRVDLLVNNAGIEHVGSFDALELADIERIVAVNLVAPMVLTRLVLPGMLARRRGHVVNIASLSGWAGIAYEAVYSASKSGLITATEALRSEYEGSDVGFSTVSPGLVGEAGMYARWEAKGVRPPRLTGTTTPAKVADAVVKAVRSNARELFVNPRPMRPLLALDALLPGAGEAIMRLSGVRDAFREAAEREARGDGPA